MNLTSLPSDMAEKLINLRETNKEEFFNLVLALRLASWPLRAIADVLGVSRESVSRWENKGQPSNNISVPIPPIPDTRDRTKATPKSALTKLETSRLRSLASTARDNSNYTDEVSPSKAASRELDEFILQLRARGVATNDIAVAAGVSKSAVNQRVRKARHE